MDKTTDRSKVLEKLYKEDMIRCLREHYDIDKIKTILNVDETNKEILLKIMSDGLKKQDLITSLYNSKNITENALIHFSKPKAKEYEKEIFVENNRENKIVTFPQVKCSSESIFFQIEDKIKNSEVKCSSEPISSPIDRIPSANETEFPSESNNIHVTRLNSPPYENNICENQAICARKFPSESIFVNVDRIPSEQPDKISTQSEKCSSEPILERVDRFPSNRETEFSSESIFERVDRFPSTNETESSSVSTQDQISYPEGTNKFLSDESKSIDITSSEVSELNSKFDRFLKTVQKEVKKKILENKEIKARESLKKCFHDIEKIRINKENFFDKLSITIKNHQNKQNKNISKNHTDFLNREWKFKKQYIDFFDKISKYNEENRQLERLQQLFLIRENYEKKLSKRYI